MDPRRIPFITKTSYSYESSESDNDIEPKLLFKRQKIKRDTAAGSGGGSTTIKATVSGSNYISEFRLEILQHQSHALNYLI